MREVFLGEYIRQRRLELGLSQRQLCEGICEPMTISRIESGTQTPSRNNINALLQRLGLPGDRYFALLSQKEMEIDTLQKEIVHCNIHKEVERGWALIRELEEITSADDRVTRQFILRSKVIFGQLDGRYTAEEQLNMLMEAIRLTVPRFDLDEINSSLYSLDEVKIINQISGVYSKNGQNKRAIDILGQLLKYIRKHYQNILQSGGLLPLIAHNYARSLSLDQRYGDAIEIAELGRQSCIQYGHYQVLPGLLSIIAECYHFLGKDAQSEDWYRQAYYLYKAIDKSSDCERVRAEVRKYLGYELHG